MASQAEAEAAREERAAAIATLRQQERELQALAAARDAAQQVTAAAGVGVGGSDDEGSEEGAGSAGPSTNGTDLLFLDVYMQRHRRIGAPPISTASSRHCSTSGTGHWLPRAQQPA